MRMCDSGPAQAGAERSARQVEGRRARASDSESAAAAQPRIQRSESLQLPRVSGLTSKRLAQAGKLRLGLLGPVVARRV